MQAPAGITNSCFVGAAQLLAQAVSTVASASSTGEEFAAALRRGAELVDEGGTATWLHAEAVHGTALRFIGGLASDGWIGDVEGAAASAVACCAAAQLRHCRDRLYFLGVADAFTRGVVLGAEGLPPVPAEAAALLGDGDADLAASKAQLQARLLPRGWDEGLGGVPAVRAAAAAALAEVARQLRR